MSAKHATIASLDGLRGLAVLAVLVDHFAWSFTDKTPLLKTYLEAGWIGVDLFFVLSGYLITRGLVKSTAKPIAERLKLFWMRRVLRIFPLYYLLLIFGALVCLALGAYAQLPTWPAWIYAQNYSLAFDTHALRWTAHTWSLAIEEQFYFFWPLLMLTIAPKLRIPLTLTMAASCFLLRAVMVLKPAFFAAHLPSFADGDAMLIARLVYRATPTHMEGLLAGALIAMFEADPSHTLSKLWARWRAVVAVLSTAALLSLFVLTRGFIAEDRRVLILGLPLLAVAFASWVSLAADGTASPAALRFLQTPRLVSVGKVSYAMYLIHWPVVALSAGLLERWVAPLPTILAIFFGFAVILAGTWLAYVFAQWSFVHIEGRFLARKEKYADA